MPTFDQFLGDAIRRLSAACPTPRLDAEVLTMHVTGFTRAQLISRAADLIPPEQQTRLEALIERREHGEPVAYITGRREFWSLPLTVTPAVLIPRPETELLVERALARLPDAASVTVADGIEARGAVQGSTGCAFADLGTGSGAIALAIARERPQARVVATDASPEALELARANAAALAIDNIEFCQGVWLAPLAGELFDIIVSNPPYIRAGDPHLQQGDVRFEPRAALASGSDGLDAIRIIVRDARAHLKPGGWLLLEHGHDQAAAIEQLLDHAGYMDIRGYTDLAGHRRVIEATIA